MALEVTELKTFISNFSSGATLGYGSIVFNDVIRVTFNVLKASSGNIFVSWPQKKKEGTDENGKADYHNFITFITPEIKKQVDDLVLKDFNKKYLAANGGKISGPKVTIVVDRTPSGGEVPQQVSEPAIESPIQEEAQPEKTKKKMIWRS